MPCLQFVCVGSHWGMVHLLDHQGNNVRNKELRAHTVAVNQISIDQNGDFIASCSDDGKVCSLYWTLYALNYGSFKLFAICICIYNRKRSNDDSSNDNVHNHTVWRCAPSWTTWTMGLWIHIPLTSWMFMFSVLLCDNSGLILCARNPTAGLDKDLKNLSTRVGCDPN